MPAALRMDGKDSGVGQPSRAPQDPDVLRELRGLHSDQAEKTAMAAPHHQRPERSRGGAAGQKEVAQRSTQSGARSPLAQRARQGALQRAQHRTPSGRYKGRSRGRAEGAAKVAAEGATSGAAKGATSDAAKDALQTLGMSERR